ELAGEHALERARALDDRPQSLPGGRRHPLATHPHASMHAVLVAQHGKQALHARLANLRIRIRIRIRRLHGRPVEERDVAALEHEGRGHVSAWTTQPERQAYAYLVARRMLGRDFASCMTRRARGSDHRLQDTRWMRHAM